MPRSLLLTDCRLCDAPADHPPATVLIADGRIRAVGPAAESRDIDVIHGDSRVLLARIGTTAFLATTFLHPKHGDAHLPPAADAVGRDLDGARVLGLHLEGPFINVRRRGGIPEVAIRPPSPAALDRLLERTAGQLRMTTFAPEVDGAMALLPRLEAAGVVPSFGHSHASYDEARAAFAAGVRHVTHLYNAMRPLHHREPGHREPGPLPAIFERPDVVAQLIVDGATSRRPWCAGPPRYSAATDAPASPTACARPACPMAATTMAAAPSSPATVWPATWTAPSWAHLPFAAAVDTASQVPARVLGLEDRKGRIAQGFDADLVLLDHDGQVHTTVVPGKAVYRLP
jgi:N-acetylglucosamine-6-phosphate deacetylase